MRADLVFGAGLDLRDDREAVAGGCSRWRLLIGRRLSEAMEKWQKMCQHLSQTLVRDRWYLGQIRAATTAGPCLASGIPEAAPRAPEFASSSTQHPVGPIDSVGCGSTGYATQF